MLKNYLKHVFIFALTLLVIFFWSFLGVNAQVPTANPVPKVALTFDDTVSKDVAGKILDTLNSENVKGTFYITTGSIKNKSKTDIDVIKRIYESGHEIGNHSHTHPGPLIYLDSTRLKNEIEQSQEILESITHQKITTIRPTHGIHNDQLRNALTQYGFKYIVLWDLDSKDYTGMTPESIVDGIITDVKAKKARYPGRDTIVLMHNLPNTAQSLPLLIKKLKSLPVEFSTVSELIENPISKADLIRRGLIIPLVDINDTEVISPGLSITNNNFAPMHVNLNYNLGLGNLVKSLVSREMGYFLYLVNMRDARQRYNNIIFSPLESHTAKNAEIVSIQGLNINEIIYEGNKKFRFSQGKLILGKWEFPITYADYFVTFKLSNNNYNYLTVSGKNQDAYPTVTDYFPSTKTSTESWWTFQATGIPVDLIKDSYVIITAGDEKTGAIKLKVKLRNLGKPRS